MSELIIVLAVGIFASIAIPASQNYLIKGRVTEGLSLVSTVPVAMEDKS